MRASVRTIFATNRDLEALVRQGRFREDLYYRINVVPLRLPPLRQRKEDIPLLVETFLDQLCSLHHKPRKQFAPDAMQFILAYRWPGNVRELKNVIERIVVTCPDREVAQEGLPSRVREVGPEPDSFPVPLGTSIQDVERELITKTLAHLTSNRREAAAVLGISVRTLQYKIKEYNLFSS